jgi:cell division protein FtsZ
MTTLDMFDSVIAEVRETGRGGSMVNKFELLEGVPQNAVIKVVGVGGGGTNAVKHMAEAGVAGVEFICMNTDAQALTGIHGARTLQIGSARTKGLGAGSDPEKGREAAMEDRDRIIEMISGADMVFVTAGMGGGTGTGAAPVVAQLAKELGILTVAVVTKPFDFEMKRRMDVALKGIDDLSRQVDSLITIPNQKLITVLPKGTKMREAFAAANGVLHGAVQGIAEVITRPGEMNMDFADVRTVMSEMGMAMMGSGSARGADRARSATEQAVSSPLLDEVNITGARGILVNITVNPDTLDMHEAGEVGAAIQEFAAEDATFKIGVVYDESLGDEMRVTVIATGLGRPAPVKAAEPKTIVLPGVATAVAPVAPAAGLAAAPTAPVAPVLNPAAAAAFATAAASAAGPVTPAQRPEVRVVPQPLPRVSGSDIDFDVPTAMRTGRRTAPELGQAELLDIPAFLRRQAD